MRGGMVTMPRWSGVAERRRFARRGIVFVPVAKGKLTGSILIDSTEVKSKMLNMTVTRMATNGMDTAVIALANAKQEYTDKWSGGEVVKVYLDFASGTTQIFEGRLMKTVPEFDRFPTLTIHAKDYGQEAMDVPVFKKYSTDTDIGEIADDLISEYLPNHTRGNIDTSTGVTATPEFQGMNLWDCLRELAHIYGDDDYDFYVDFDKDWHFFKKGSRTHDQTSGIAAVYGQNLITTNVNDPLMNKKNKITIKGQDVDGVPIIATKENESDQNKYWTMHEVIMDTNLTTQAQVENKAASILTERLTPKLTGKIVTDGLPGATPGYKIMVSDPGSNLNGFVTITRVSHMVRNGYRTEIEFSEGVPKPESDEIANVMRDRVDNEQRRLSIDNEHGMENTYSFTFDDDTNIQQHSKTETSRGSLILQVDETVGTMITETKAADKDITKALVKVNGTNITNTEFHVSNNGGSTYESVEPNTVTTLSATGKNLRLKVTLNSASTEIKSLSVMYK